MLYKYINTVIKAKLLYVTKFIVIPQKYIKLKLKESFDNFNTKLLNMLFFAKGLLQR